jgi:hypothetical protein
MEKTFGFSKEKVGDPEYNNAIADKAKTVPAIGEALSNNLRRRLW